MATSARPVALARIARAYSSLAVVVLNTLLAFVFLNVAAGGAMYVWRRLHPRDSGFRMAQMDERTAMAAYPGWRSEDVGELLRETYGRKYQFQPYTQFAERPFHGKHLNTEEAGYRSIGRAQVWPPSPASYNIFVFGGSTTFGWGVPDSETIPAALQARLDASGKRVVVYNFGRDGYFSGQEMVLLNRLLSAGNVPNMAIFIDGLNDFAAWKGEPDFSDELRQLVDRHQAQATMGSAGVELLRAMPLGIVLETFGRKATRVGALDSFKLHTDRETLDGVISRWRTHRKVIEGVGREFHFETVFAWQPVPVYRYDISKHFLAAEPARFDYGERAKAGYPIAAAMRAELEQGGDFVWLADMQDGRHENLYVDGFHYTSAFCADIARRIAEFVEPRINPARTPTRSPASAPGPAPL